jgi:hypothetical protein
MGAYTQYACISLRIAVLAGIGTVHQFLGDVIVVPLLSARLDFLGPIAGVAIPPFQGLHTFCKYFHWLQRAVNERLIL